MTGPTVDSSNADISDRVLAVMETCRAIRHYRSEPVPAELLERLVYAATRAPSPRNVQPWEFVIITDSARLSQLRTALSGFAEELRLRAGSLSDTKARRMVSSAADLVESLDSVPAVVLVCGRAIDLGPGYPSHDALLSALHTAAQNLIVAARAHGLGAAFTTLHLHAEHQIREILKAPDDVHIAVTIPVGWPQRGTGMVARRPVAEVIHWNQFRRPSSEIES